MKRFHVEIQVLYKDELTSYTEEVDLPEELVCNLTREQVANLILDELNKRHSTDELV
jgi:hypothetical protein